MDIPFLCARIINDDVYTMWYNMESKRNGHTIAMHEKGCEHCYIVLIEKEYVEARYRLYSKEIVQYKEYACF